MKFNEEMDDDNLEDSFGNNPLNIEGSDIDAMNIEDSDAEEIDIDYFDIDDTEDELDYGYSETAATREKSKRTQKNDRRTARRKRQQRNVTKIGILVSAVLVIVLAAAFMLQRYTPTKAKMNGYTYFDIDVSSENLVVLDGELHENVGTYIDGQLYLPQRFIADYINVRYYYDVESNAVLYTDSTKTYTFETGQTQYKDSKGEIYSWEHPVTVLVGDVVYLNWEFVAKHTNCTYVYGTEPARISVCTEHEEITAVTATKTAAVRYRAGIKSEILENVEKGTMLTYVDGIDEWSRVTTPSGFTGYVRNSEISDQVIVVPEDTYVENYNKIQKDEKLSIAWFQVASAYGNQQIDDYLAGTSGITTISPTWYSITDASGNMDCYATAEFVNKMHRQGIEVWPLVNDFNTDVDFKTLYSSKATRTKMIQTLMNDAARYSYDGINIDFEHMDYAYNEDFLQFIRELSVACEERNLVLSTDNYKPESYNASYNLREQSSFVDYLILMAYDEHYAGSDAGSVASIGFVEEGIQQMLELVPKEQVVAAIPFYTRVWTTNAEGTTSVAVDMQTGLDQISIYGTTALWSEEAGQYVMAAESSKGSVQIWLEEDRSVGEKMKKIQEYELAGAAYWRLGFENSSVWSVINQYLQE